MCYVYRQLLRAAFAAVVRMRCDAVRAECSRPPAPRWEGAYFFRLLLTRERSERRLMVIRVFTVSSSRVSGRSSNSSSL